ncbi:MAG: HutD family protein [Alphaproteobacteria bacterium]|nr:HutD family protein [Alphaproteobacteria bacterium]
MITPIDPATYAERKWLNGGGTMVDIATGPDDLWRFSRTPIVAAGPFSDYKGHDRCQVLIKGRGIALKTPHGEIDVRTPFEPARFAGETSIVSQLDDGPVEVVNLIGDRAAVRIDLQVATQGRYVVLHPGTHIAYCVPGEDAALDCGGEKHALAGDRALRIEPMRRTILAATGGRLLVASILRI